MSSVPERPTGVPEGATWDDGDQEWGFGPAHDDKKHGQFFYWRPDGTLCNICHYVEGVPHGAFYRFHENGELSQRGNFVRGKMHGLRHCYRATSATTERSMEGLGDSVWRTEIHYDMDIVLKSHAFDAAGKQVCDDGTPMPTLPAGLPHDAHFNAREKVWHHGETRLHPDGKYTKEGTWRWWTAAGVLVRESNFAVNKAHGTHRELFSNGKAKVTGEYVHGAKTGTWETWREDGTLESRVQTTAAGKTEESFDAAGKRESYSEEDAQGQRHGTRQYAPEEGQLSLPAVAMIRGEYTHGRMTGSWELLDAAGQVLWRMPLGKGVGPTKLAEHPFLAEVEVPQAQLRTQLFHALSESRMIEAVLAGVRLAGAGDGAPLKGLLQAFQFPNVDEYRRGYAQYLIKSMDLVLRSAPTDRLIQGLVPAYVEAIFQGADAPTLFRSLAITFDQHGRSRAALDFIVAALAVAPERQAYRFTEALIHMSLGNFPAADDAIAALTRVEPEQGQYLAQYAALVAEPFAFWPASVQGAPSGGPTSPNLSVRSPAELMRVFDVLVARLGRARDELLRRGLPADAPWMIPDLSDVCATAPQLDDQTFSGIDFDASIPDLLGAARCEWFVLCFLSGAAGAMGVLRPVGGVQAAATGLVHRIHEWVQTCEAASEEPYEGPMRLWNGVLLQGIDARLVGIITKVPGAGALFADWLTNKETTLPWEAAADEEEEDGEAEDEAEDEAEEDEAQAA